jgi:hypothetical protein
MFRVENGKTFVVCDSCKTERALGIRPGASQQDAIISATYWQMYEVFMGRAICGDCRCDPVIVEREQMQYALSQIPQRFLEKHVVEFAVWSPQDRGPRTFILDWPFGFSHEPRTITLDRRKVAVKGQGMAVEIFIPDEAEIPLMQRYVKALQLADAGYQRVQASARRARA